MTLIVRLRRFFRHALLSSSRRPKHRFYPHIIRNVLLLFVLFLTLTVVFRRQILLAPTSESLESVVRYVIPIYHAGSSDSTSPGNDNVKSTTALDANSNDNNNNNSARKGGESAEAPEKGINNVYEPLRSRVDAIVGEGHSAKKVLVHVYALPNVVVSNMTQHVATRLYWKLVYTDVVRALHMYTESASQPASDHQPAWQPHATVLFVHAQNGLGNRLRAVASGIALARATHRVPVIVWQRDAHLGASLSDIFSVNAAGSDVNSVLYRDLIIMEDFPSWTQVPLRDTYWHAFNYMQKDGRGAKTDKLMRFQLPTNSIALRQPPSGIAAPPDAIHAVLRAPPPPAVPEFDEGLIRHHQHVYFKSGYVANVSPPSLTRRADVNAELRALMPTAAVSAIVAKFDANRLRYSYGVHIRSRTLANDNVAVNNDCEYTQIGAWTTDYWRSQSQLPVFVNKMRQKLRLRKDATFFVAADDRAVISSLEELFPGRIYSIHRNCDDREAGCVVYAMADLLCLAKTRRLYGSNWSSFSEVAGRLTNRRLYLSGKDFGRPKRPGRVERVLKSFPLSAWKWWLKIRRPYYGCHLNR